MIGLRIIGAFMRPMLVSFCWCLLALCLNAAAPKCESLEQDGKTFQQCEREDVSCGALAREQRNAPSDKWWGCAWPATIFKTQLMEHGVRVFVTHVRLTPSFRDTQRMDITVTIEKSDHTSLKLDRKDVPVNVRDTIPVADIHADAEFMTPFDPLGVPTVDATEKGGAKTPSHSYR